MKVYDGIMQGLNEAIAYNEGKIKARTNTMSIEAAEIKSRPRTSAKTEYYNKIKYDKNFKSNH